ncbi:MAG: hypothetical protein J5I93_23470 [Pirellulaceae bacterium]|nr:hypothetical protein [Pirellulaceae bacterium]
MPEIKGQRLHVRLGASQVRKRLKGLGYGVRKVQTTGIGAAVIIHTATGQHERELRALFADVLVTHEPEYQPDDVARPEPHDVARRE